MGEAGFFAATVALVAAYLLLLGGATAFRTRTLIILCALSYALLVSGPPLLSRDLVGYIAYGRMVLYHHLNPYTQVAAQMGADPILPFVGWPFSHTPYGPLFTLISLPLVALGLVGSFWAFKGLCAVAATAALGALAQASRRRGIPPQRAVVYLGANPAFLELTVGGNHNDTLVVWASAAALSAALALHPRRGAASLVGGLALKLSAGLPLLFMVLSPSAAGGARSRLRLVGFVAALLLAFALVTLALFGPGGLDPLSALGAEQAITSPHSVPRELSYLLGLRALPTWLRLSFLGAFALALLALALRTARGADWVEAAGFAYLGLLAATAWLVPWYACWPLPFAALSKHRALPRFAFSFSCYCLCFHLPGIAPLLGTPPSAPSSLPPFLSQALR